MYNEIFFIKMVLNNNFLYRHHWRNTKILQNYLQNMYPFKVNYFIVIIILYVSMFPYLFGPDHRIHDEGILLIFNFHILNRFVYYKIFFKFEYKIIITKMITFVNYSFQ